MIKGDEKEIFTSEAIQCGHCATKVRMKVMCEGRDSRTTDFECTDYEGNQYTDCEDEQYKWQVLQCLVCHQINVFQSFSSSLEEYTLNGETWIRPTRIESLYPSSNKVVNQGIFFEGQYFNAIKQVIEILDSAKRNIIVIDNYIDSSLLDILSAKALDVEIKVLTKNIKEDKQFIVKAKSFIKQYRNLSVRVSSAFHDRFIVIDEQEYFHLGASIKDLGNKGFMFSQIQDPSIKQLLYERWVIEWAKAEIKV
jgi:hypothetical protein